MNSRMVSIDPPFTPIVLSRWPVLNDAIQSTLYIPVHSQVLVSQPIRKSWCTFIQSKKYWNNKTLQDVSNIIKSFLSFQCFQGHSGLGWGGRVLRWEWGLWYRSFGKLTHPSSTMTLSSKVELTIWTWSPILQFRPITERFMDTFSPISVPSATTQSAPTLWM